MNAYQNRNVFIPRSSKPGRGPSRWYKLLAVISMIGLLVIPNQTHAAPSSIEFTTLRPGEFVWINHPLPVNIVFVGMDQGSEPWQVDMGEFSQILPNYSFPIAMMFGYYSYLYPIEFLYQYNVVFADQAFEDALFTYMTGIATPMPLTHYQELYNTQQTRSLTITENSWIEAEDVESWLAENAGLMLGVDTTQYTVFFINWYGRSDFKFHVYVNSDVPDPDTGVNKWLAGEQYRLIAWGGTDTNATNPSRVWYYDASAGPDFYSSGWAIDNPEVPDSSWIKGWPPVNNGIPDYRMPPIWEYDGITSSGPPFANLGFDLGLITRMVAINMFFTQVSTYWISLPSVNPLPNEIELDINVFNFDPGFDAGSSLNPDLLAARLQSLQPWNHFTWERTFHDPQKSLQNIYDCFINSIWDPNAHQCYGSRSAYYDPFSGLDWYFEDHLLQYTEGQPEYEVPIFTFALPDPLPGQRLLPTAGRAGAPVADITQQSAVFNWYYPFELEERGEGQTLVLIHEVGHHFGATHPFNTIDVEWGFYYDSYYDAFHFAYLGNESATIMGYTLAGNGNFSRFDRDNMDRWFTVWYLNYANFYLPQILKSPRLREVSDLVKQADQFAGISIGQLQAMEYDAAAWSSQSAFDKVVEAAKRINVVLEPGCTPGNCSTRAMDRSPFLRQYLNHLAKAPDTIGPGNLPEAVPAEYRIGTLP